jgi:hypothetical protein
MHFHYDKLISLMEADHAATAPAAGPDGGELVVAIPALRSGEAARAAAE